MKLIIGGGAALSGLVLAASIFVIAKPLNAGVPVQQPNQSVNQNTQISTPKADSDHTAEVNKDKEEAAKAVTADRVSKEGQVFSATAYSLPGHTASGLPVGRGVLAADPRILPLGTRVMISAGSYSGEYVIADTGTAIKGNRLDIWMASYKEACHWGRRDVKLTVISYPNRKGGVRQTVGPKPTPVVTNAIPMAEGRRARVVQ